MVKLDYKKITSLLCTVLLLTGTLTVAVPMSMPDVFAQSSEISVNAVGQNNRDPSLPELPLKQFITGQKEPNFASNQLIIGFKSDITPEEIKNFYKDFQSDFGLEEKKSLGDGNHGKPTTKLVKTSTSVNSAIIAKLKDDPRVEFAEPDYIITIDTINTNDTYRNLLWGLDNTGQTVNNVVGTTDADIDAPEAWGISTGSSNIIAGIIDTGVDYNHEDLSANIWTNPGETAGNGVDDDANGYVDDIHGWNAISNSGDPLDDHGHGTHVAGTIGAIANNGKGIVGVNHHVTIIACKFLDKNGSGFTSDAIECFNYFSNLKLKGINVRVTNNSWGGGGYSTSLYNSMNNGILHAVAAGNSGVNIDTSPSYPASYNLDNIISVAATNSNDNYASFSNYGPVSVDIAGPGVNIASTWINNQYYYASGTSMAAPHVTGAAALTWSVNQALTWNQVKNLILTNGDPLAGQKTLTDKRLNVNNILSSISPSTPTPPQISINDQSITEGNSGTKTITFTLTRTGDPTQTSNVDYSTSDGTANSGSDYVSTSGTVSFSASVSSQTIIVTVNGDTIVEPNETFNVDLSNCSNCSIADVRGVGTIINDDSPLSVSVTTDKGSYKSGSNVIISVNVKDSNLNNVGGSVVSISVNGGGSDKTSSCLSSTGSTNASGNASFTCSTSGYARGTYTVTAHATKLGYIPGDGITSFRVR